MPFYEYQCTECGHRLEALQRISDEPLRDCPECGAVSLKKLISKAAFKLKGAGWYETDFKHSGKKPEGGKGDQDKQSKGKESAGAAAEKPGGGKNTAASDKPAAAPTHNSA